MQDTSFAIHPGNKKQLKNTPYRDIGHLESYKQNGNLIELKCEQGNVHIQFYRDDIVRIVMNPFQKPLMTSSFALIAEPSIVDLQLEEQSGQIQISSGELLLVIGKFPLRINIFTADGRLLVGESERGMGFNEKREVICYKDMLANDHFYGFGEKTSFLDKRGEKMTMWNSDVYAPHNPEIDALYESIPYFLTLRDGKAHGIFFDNTHKTVFDMKSEQDTYSFWAEGGQIDYYVLAGPSPKDVLMQYTSLTGRMPIPPKWALGYHQSRYSYETEQEVRELAAAFLKKGIPVDAIYLDIHYMDGYRVFTFDQERFPNPKQLIADLKEAGIHVVPIVDPGVKEDPEYNAYQEGIYGDHFCKYIDGTIYHGDVWPGNSAFPDFTNTKTREWWGEKHHFYTDLGIEGIWNDMNEPAVFNETKTMDVKVMHGNDGNPKTHKEMHNVYGLLMGAATYNALKQQNKGNRPFLLTRAGYAGVQRYGAVWTGDNRSFWEHLAMALPMCMNLGISGVPFTGPDVGGFAHDASGELLARWTQFGTFTPYFRNHSGLDTVRQEPWSFGANIENIVKKYIQLRYKWLPHLYTLFHEASMTGLPVMRPLLMEYPMDENTFNLSDQFLIGENIIIAPILKPSTFHRVIYLPEGNWFDYWTGKSYKGGAHFLVEAPLDTLPIFVKEGAILPHGRTIKNTSEPMDKLDIHIYKKTDGISVYKLYEDDGKTFDYENGSYLMKEIVCHFNNKTITIMMEDLHNGYKPSWNMLEFMIHGLDEEVEIVLNDTSVVTNFNKQKRTILFQLSI
ncbi:glycoside hydrolase family 31 protein [Bacillus sp. FJAT-49736]|uniref:glycoside hydrolase family 31 protein n=1 Tax=Bacillus sp. FJAT-49736 TaxID=2833582 RepID=UPI001BC967C6|nr:glycoside hydrolase family 31 protein [Bacillus sp. FJAT-49736]MBS4174888.1 glycoside hydrolase family 31 protein [Bacillus sp. FJAT-49736]